MPEHIAYAMRNTEAVHSLISLNAPSALHDWSYLVIEGIIVLGAVLAVAHAMRHRRQSGQSSALRTLLCCFTYGLLTDITAYYTVENFWHGEFSVMLLYNRLPLYIALFYPAFIYHLVMTLRRYAFTPLVEAVSVAFYGGLTYMIFDNLGPMLGWWIWDPADPTTWPYLNSVPMTSYYWFFTFTGSFALLNRWICWDGPARGWTAGRIAAGVAVLPFATYACGAALFVPYNLLSGSGLMAGAGALYSLLFALAGGVLLFHYRRPRVERDVLLMLFPLTYLVGHLFLYVSKFDLFLEADADGLTREGLAVGNPIAAVVALLTSGAILLATHPARIDAETEASRSRS